LNNLLAQISAEIVSSWTNTIDDRKLWLVRLMVPFGHLLNY
jgi:hypothetical protein